VAGVPPAFSHEQKATKNTEILLAAEPARAFATFLSFCFCLPEPIRVIRVIRRQKELKDFSFFLKRSRFFSFVAK
jgi:hypothetical protein